MRKVFLLFPLVLCSVTNAQVGISTTYPQGTLHVDGAKDNPVDSAPSVIQQSNDFIVTSSGNIGIGTITPVTKMDIISSSSGAIKIADGTQGENKVLMSNADGIGTWNTLNSTKATILGQFPATSQTINSSGTTGVKGTGVKVSLTKGKWIVNAGLTIASLISTQRIWLHAYLSSRENEKSSTGFELIGPAGANSSYAGVISPRVDVTGDGKFSMLSGSQIINVISDTVDIWLVIENRATNTWTYSTGSFENYFFAIPIN